MKKTLTFRIAYRGRGSGKITHRVAPKATGKKKQAESGKLELE